MNTLLKPSETDDTDAIAAAYLYAAKGDPSAALIQAVSDAVVAIEELRSRFGTGRGLVLFHTRRIRDASSLLSQCPRTTRGRTRAPPSSLQ